jgi:hypothetical protein
LIGKVFPFVGARINFSGITISPNTNPSLFASSIQLIYNYGPGTPNITSGTIGYTSAISGIYQAVLCMNGTGSGTTSNAILLIGFINGTGSIYPIAADGSGTWSGCMIGTGQALSGQKITPAYYRPIPATGQVTFNSCSGYFACGLIEAY